MLFRYVVFTLLWAVLGAKRSSNHKSFSLHAANGYLAFIWKYIQLSGCWHQGPQ